MSSQQDSEDLFDEQKVFSIFGSNQAQMETDTQQEEPELDVAKGAGSDPMKQQHSAGEDKDDGADQQGEGIEVFLLKCYTYFQHVTDCSPPRRRSQDSGASGQQQ